MYRPGIFVRSCSAIGLALACALPAHADVPEPARSLQTVRQTVTVFAAASLREPFEELGRLLERQRPGTNVVFSFAGSNTLAVQIGIGAHADVYASADMHWMRYVRDTLRKTRADQIFAYNRMAIIVPANNPRGIQHPRDLARSGVKIVVAAPAVPVGAYAHDMLTKMSASPGFGPQFAERVDANVVSREQNVSAVVTKVALGEADAALVYRSDVGRANAAKVRLIPIPDVYNVLASYPIAVVTDTQHAILARAFVDMVMSPAGQAVLARHGFVPVGDGIARH